MSRAMSMKSKSASKQHGAIGLMMAVAMLALVLFAALAIDMARLTYQKQALQSVADIAALEVSRSNPYFIDGDMSAIENELQTKYQAQDKVTSLEVRSGSAKIEDSQWVFSESEPSATAFNSDYSAAQVVVTKSVPQSMIAGGLFGDNTLVLTARAAIQKSGVIRFGVGTELLKIEPSESSLLNSVLSGLLGTSINLGVAGYQGLVDSKIMIGSLVNQVGIASVDEVLNSQLELANLSDYLNLDDGVGELLDQVSQLNVTVGDIIGISPGRESAALATTLSALDIIRAAAIYAGNGKTGISIPNLDVNVLGLVSASGSLSIIEAPKFKVALLPIKAGEEPMVENTQLDLVLTNEVNVLGLLGVKINMRVKGASSEAKITDSNDDSYGRFIDIAVTRKLTSIKIDEISVKALSLITLLKAKPEVTLTNNNAYDDVRVYLSDIPADGFYEKSLSTNNLGIVVDANVSVLGIGLGLLLDADGILGGLISDLISGLLMPVLNVLGLSLNDTTVWVDAAGTTQYGLIK